MNVQAYEILWCLPSIRDALPGSENIDVSSTEDERLTTLSLVLFLWLFNIQPRYMVYTLDMGVMVEPYMPN